MITKDDFNALSQALSQIQFTAAETGLSMKEFAAAMKQFASTGARLDIAEVNPTEPSKYKTLQYKHEVIPNGNDNS